MFGRYRTEKEVGEAGALVSRTVELPTEDWEVLIRDHHPGYIDWSQYLENQRRLERNRTYGPDQLTPGPAREGRALLQGLVVCGGCGHRLSVRYAGNGGLYPHYTCYRARREGLAWRARCRSLRADVADEAVVARVLEALTPAHLELAAEAMEELESRRKAERGLSTTGSSGASCQHPGARPARPGASGSIHRPKRTSETGWPALGA